MTFFLLLHLSFIVFISRWSHAVYFYNTTVFVVSIMFHLTTPCNAFQYIDITHNIILAQGCVINYSCRQVVK